MALSIPAAPSPDQICREILASTEQLYLALAEEKSLLLQQENAKILKYMNLNQPEVKNEFPAGAVQFLPWRAAD